SKFNKFLIFLTGLMIIDAGAQVLLAAFSDDQLDELLFTWPWIMLPMMVASITIALESVLKK
ncbi:MAG: hypothetical protein ACW99A_23155, partial [Candidatus Kariarchaeaceae archaeon]